MATKAQMYAQMADHAAVQLTSSWNEWMRFLDTASRLYKYPFHDQLMIYAQRPDATACAEYDLWNDKMGRYVRRGSKGIALVDDSGEYSDLCAWMQKFQGFSKTLDDKVEEAKN